MPSEISKYLKQNGFDTSVMKVYVFEALTTENEIGFEGMVDQLEGKEFSDLSVMVFDQPTLESYVNYE
jgi:cobalt-precorrin-7 (C5)-methyltransferase